MSSADKTVAMLIVFLLCIPLPQNALGVNSFDVQNSEPILMYPEGKCTPFSLELTKRGQNSERADDESWYQGSESSKEDWPYFFIDDDPVYNWAYGYQRRPAIVWGDGNYLVAWDQKVCSNCETDIYLTRVSPDVDVLDTVGLPVCTASENQFFPAVAYNGSGYFVVWEDFRNGTWDIYGARVSLEGEVLDPEGKLIWKTTNHEVRADIAWDGTNYLVVWQGIQPTLPTTSIFGALVNPQGGILDEFPILISNDTLTANYNPAVAWDGTNYLVVWEDEGG
jgi:hypothetical protein